MANISKELVHQCSNNVIKVIVDPKLVFFKRVELGASSNTRFFGVKDVKGNDMFWVVLLDESSGFGRGYVNIIKKGNDPAKKQESMVNAWKKVRKSLSTKKAGIALVDPDLPNNENPFPLTAKLVTEDKASASKTPLGNLVEAVYSAFVANKPDEIPFTPTTATIPEYDHQMELALPHKTLWEYVYPSNLRESPTGETADLLKVLAADLKDSCFIVRLTGVTVKSGTDDYGKDVSIIKVCMKVHYIVEIPNLGAFIKVKTSAPEDAFSGASFDSFTNGMSGSAFYKDLVGPSSAIRTPAKKDKGANKKAVVLIANDATLSIEGDKVKKSRAKKTKGEDESPLKKPKKVDASIEETSSDEKLAAEMDKLMDETALDGEIEDGDGDEDDGDEVVVVEETQRDELDSADIKARKTARRVV